MAVNASNIQIDSLQDSIYSMNRLLSQKHDDLERLQRAHKNLVTCQDDFTQYETVCTDPKMSADTWHGSLASRFESFQENELLPSYQSLSKSELNQILRRVRDEIDSIKRSIGDIQGSISIEQTRLDQLMEGRSK